MIGLFKRYSNSLFDLPEIYRKDNPDIQVTEKRKIQVVTLDGFTRDHKLEGHGLVKIDVEGAELNVLTGGEKFFKQQVSAVILELAFNRGCFRIDQVMNKLSEYNFLLYNVFDVYRSDAPENRLVQMDAVYLKKAPK